MVLSLGEWLFFAAAVATGAALQSVVGFGLALLVAPIVGIVRPDLMPTALIMMSYPLSVSMAYRGRRDIDWTNLGWSMLPRIPTVAIGVALVAVVSNRVLGGLVGALVVISCAISALGTPSPITRARAIRAGAMSGFMEATAAVGGAPMGLLYAARPATEVRSTLAMSFIGGKSFALVALAFAGEITADAIWAAVSLYPALYVGSIAARPLTARVGNRSMRPVVLALCSATGVMAMINSLVG